MAFFNNRLQHFSSDELKSVGLLCAGAALLIAVALVLSGSLPFLPQPLKLAVSNIRQTAATANAAAVPYWQTSTGWNFGGYPAPTTCTMNWQSGSYPVNCFYDASMGILSALNLSGSSGVYASGIYQSGNGYAPCYPSTGQWYPSVFRRAATSSPLVVSPGATVQLDWACQPSQTGSGYMACGDGWENFGTQGIYTSSYMVDSAGTTYNPGGNPLIGTASVTANWTTGTTRYFRLYCTAGSGNNMGAGTNVLNATVPVVITTATLSLTANPSAVQPGGTSELSWSTSNVQPNSCTISGPNGIIGSQGLGTDASGNGSNWTPNNITSADQLADTPTNNFATLNQTYYYSPTYSKGTVQGGGLAANAGHGAVAGWQLTSGKWYWEYVAGGISSGYPIVGVWEDPSSNQSYRAYPGQNNDTGIGWGSDGKTYYNSYTTQTPALSAFTTGDMLGVAYDADTGKVYFAKNGAWQNGGNPAGGTGYVAVVRNGWPGIDSNGGKTYINFGAGGGPSTVFADSSSYARAAAVLPALSSVKPSSAAADAKFGGASANFGGAGYLRVPSSASLNFGTGDFTVDAWVKFGGAGDYTIISGQSSGDFMLARTGNNALQVGRSLVAWDSISPAQTWTAGVWYHIAVARQSGTLRMFVNGAQIYSGANANSYNFSSALTVGSREGAYFFSGFMDELRLSSTARWSANFTPPASAYSSDANTTLLLHLDNSKAGSYSSAAGGYFAYAPPAGYKALSTDNLPDPAVPQPSQYFNAAAYSGNGGQQTVATGLAPDLVWIKNRTVDYWHTLTDSSRGTNSDLFSNSPSAATQNDPNGWVSALTATGFSVGGQCSATPPNVNVSGNTYVAWAWKKSPASGVDIVTYQGDGAASRQIAHALGAAPEMVMVKRTDASGDWYVWTKDLPDQSYYLKLNAADQRAGSNSPWGGGTSGNVTSSAFTVGANAANNANASGGQYVAYLFRSIDQFSKIGSYASNGSADGPVVYTGFKPKFVMIKNTTATGNWRMVDGARSAATPAAQELSASLADAELTGGSSNEPVDLLQNGFKLRGTGGDGNNGTNTYAYIAFADVPFKYSASSTYAVPQSLRLDAANNPSMSRTPGQSGSLQKGTLSFWVKRNQNASHQYIISTPSRYELVAFYWNCGQDQLDIRLPYNGNELCSTYNFRDPARWYHVVIAYDSTQATPSDRVKLYVDGVQNSLTAPGGGTPAYPAQNLSMSRWNLAGYQQSLFYDQSANGYNFDGEVADFYYIDGVQLGPSAFGGSDSAGVWRPAAYSGTYGTNGFFLNFQNSLDLGADASGAGRNLALTNISALDRLSDTPSNSFATLSQVDYYSPTYGKGTVQAGGLAANGGWGAVADWQLSSGLWYWEYVVGGGGANSNTELGVWKDPTSATGNRAYPGHNSEYGFGYGGGGAVRTNGAAAAGPVVSSFGNGDVIGVAYNAGTGAVYASKNGQWQSGADLIPQMTGYATGGVTLSASSYYNASYLPWYAGDKAYNSGWESGATLASGPQWLRAQFGSAQTVGSYSIQNFYNAAAGNYDPVDFQLQGSNDSSTCSSSGTAWTTLDTQTGVAWQLPAEVKYFTVPSANRGSYLCYRLYVTGAGSPQSPANWLVIDNWGLHASAAQSPADGSVAPIGTVTDGWPGLSSPNGKTYVNFGAGGGQATTFADSSSYSRAMSVVGLAQPSAAAYKFGGASAYFNGSSAITTPMTPGLNPTGDYTIDLWVRPASLPGGVGILSREYSGGASPYMLYLNGSSISFYSSSNGGWEIANAQPVCTGVAVNTWYHLAVVRQGNTYRTFCNGAQTATWTSSATPWRTGYPLAVGRYATSAYFTGYIDEVRISNTARWTSNFTPPAGAYASDANTLLLLHLGDDKTNFYASGAGGYFAYAPPAGYLALSTANLPTPPIALPNKYFDAKAYTGENGVPAFDLAGKGSYITLSNNNYDAVSSTNCCWSNNFVYSTSAFSSGKWYAEFKIGGNYPAGIGIGDASKRQTPEAELGYLSTEYGYDPYYARTFNNNAYVGGYPGLTAGDTVMVAVDMDAGKLWFGKNGAWLGSGNPATGAGPQYTGLSGTKAFAVSMLAAAGPIQANFGQAGRSGTSYRSAAGGYFAYLPPSGFLALPSGGSQDIALAFTPDLVWIKNRAAAYWNTLVDSGRGAGFDLFSNSTSAQTQNDVNGTVTALTSSGFTVGGSCAAPSGNVNAAGSTYAAWVWKKSQAAGIDVKSYVGNGAASQSVAHTLGTTPDFILAKRTDQPGDWFAWFSALGGGNFLKLNATDAGASQNSPFSADLIPVMTAATTGGVTMSASTEYQPAWYAGDKIGGGRYWYTHPNVPSTGSPQWLKVDLGTSKTVAAYSLTSYYNATNYLPVDFQLQGSNDNSAWTTLDTEQGVGWIYINQLQTFAVPAGSQAPYRYYRLYITRTEGNPVILQEFSLWAAGAVPSAAAFGVTSNATNNANASGGQYIAYLFSNREGFSRSGTYIGNGSADGPFVYTGFKPKFVMIKNTSTGNSNTSWVTYDSARSTGQPLYNILFPNLGSVEGNDGYCTNANCPIDFYGNGFKPRNAGYWPSNTGGNWYAYAAFADVPFKSASTPYNLDIPYSLRFDASASSYLSRTFTAAGNQKTWTLSAWVKRGALGSGQDLFAAGTDASNYTSVGFTTSDQLHFDNKIAGTLASKVSSAVFRDPSAWLHVVVAVDTTQAAAASRVRLYVNGVEISSWAADTAPAQNAETFVDKAISHTIGSFRDGATSFFDGNMADVYLVDGVQLGPGSFGGYDTNGFWKPLAYAAALGQNGFHLDFSSVGSTDFSASTGAITVGPLFKSSTYTLTCTSVAEGVPIPVSATVTVGNAQLALTACNAAGTSCSSSSAPAYVNPSDSAYLYWSAPGADANSCNVTYPGGGTLAPANTNTVSQNTPSQSAGLTASLTTFTLQCTAGGTATSTTAQVSTSQACQTGIGSAGSSCSSQCSFKSDRASAPPGGTATVSWCCPAGPSAGVNFSTGGARYGTADVGAGTYQLNCPSGAGTLSILSAAVLPTISSNPAFKATRVRPGSASTLTWQVSGMQSGMSCVIAPAGKIAAQPDWAAAGSPSTWSGTAQSTALDAPTQFTLSCGSETDGWVRATATAGLLPTFREI